MKLLYSVSYFLLIFISVGCASKPPSQPDYSEQKELINTLLQTEFKNIIDSAPKDSRVGVDWCFDFRLEYDPESQLGPVSAVSDWAQRQIEKLLVDSGNFVMVSRRYLKNIQREQDLQTSSRIDENTAVSVCRNLGLSYLVIPEITRMGTLSVQLIDAETDQIHYVNLVDIDKPWRKERGKR
jgi:curli biogenesis system outer membrane secretion channel CsgG